MAIISKRIAKCQCQIYIVVIYSSLLVLQHGRAILGILIMERIAMIEIHTIVQIAGQRVATEVFTTHNTELIIHLHRAVILVGCTIEAVGVTQLLVLCIVIDIARQIAHIGTMSCRIEIALRIEWISRTQLQIEWILALILPIGNRCRVKAMRAECRSKRARCHRVVYLGADGYSIDHIRCDIHLASLANLGSVIFGHLHLFRHLCRCRERHHAQCNENCNISFHIFSEQSF